EVNQVSFSPDGESLATACDDGGIRLWNLRSNKMTLLGRHHRKALAVAFAPNGKHVASTGQDKAIRIWHIAETPEPSSAVAWADSHVRCLAWAPDSSFVVSGEESAAAGNVRLWTVDGHPVARVRAGTLVTSLAVRADGRRLLIADNVGTIGVWDQEA